MFISLLIDISHQIRTDLQDLCAVYSSFIFCLSVFL